MKVSDYIVASVFVFIGLAFAVAMVLIRLHNKQEKGKN
jgi:hypothetical protein